MEIFGPQRRDLTPKAMNGVDFTGILEMPQRPREIPRPNRLSTRFPTWEALDCSKLYMNAGRPPYPLISLPIYGKTCYPYCRQHVVKSHISLSLSALGQTTGVRHFFFSGHRRRLN